MGGGCRLIISGLVIGFLRELNPAAKLIQASKSGTCVGLILVFQRPRRRVGGECVEKDVSFPKNCPILWTVTLGRSRFNRVRYPAFGFCQLMTGDEGRGESSGRESKFLSVRFRAGCLTCAGIIQPSKYLRGDLAGDRAIVTGKGPSAVVDGARIGDQVTIVGILAGDGGTGPSSVVIVAGESDAMLKGLFSSYRDAMVVGQIRCNSGDCGGIPSLVSAQVKLDEFVTGARRWYPEGDGGTGPSAVGIHGGRSGGSLCGSSGICPSAVEVDGMMRWNQGLSSSQIVAMVVGQIRCNSGDCGGIGPSSMEMNGGRSGGSLCGGSRIDPSRWRWMPSDVGDLVPVKRIDPNAVGIQASLHARGGFLEVDGVARFDYSGGSSESRKLNCSFQELV